MSTPDRQLAFSARFLRRCFALACAGLLLLGSSANAGSITVLEYGQTNPFDVVTATDTGLGTTNLSTAGNPDGLGVSIPVTITNFLGSSVTIPAFETFEQSPGIIGVGLTSVGSASTFHGSIFQNFMGTIAFTSLPFGSIGNANFLTATFAPVGPMSATGISGGAGGAGAGLGGAQPTDVLTLTSDFAILAPPTGMAIGFSNIATPPGLHIAADGSIASFTAQNSGTFSATMVIPEPSSLCLGSFAVVFGVLVYCKKKR